MLQPGGDEFNRESWRRVFLSSSVAYARKFVGVNPLPALINSCISPGPPLSILPILVKSLVDPCHIRPFVKEDLRFTRVALSVSRGDLDDSVIHAHNWGATRVADRSPSFLFVFLFDQGHTQPFRAKALVSGHTAY